VGLINEANPQDLVGNELVVIAAVVVGGASIFGGKGSVTGTVLGVLLIELINSSLITLGIPSAWDNVAIGVLILLGVSFQLAGRRPGRAGILAGAQ
jgi:simple sugar transport system permease protein